MEPIIKIVPQELTKEESLIFDPNVLNQQPDHIPQQFVWSEKDKPSSDVPTLQVPLIDLAAGDTEESLRLISEAAKQHGFFLVTNHGVDEKLLSCVYKLMDAFFESPSCEKQKAQRKRDESSGYVSSFVGRFGENLPWKETLSFRFSPEENTVNDYILETMGEGYKDFGIVYQEYAEAISSLSLKVMELLGMSLGIKRNHFREFFEDNDSIFRLNYYPRCKQPDQTLGIGPHSDPCSLTILHQDQIGGLQVFVDNKWQSIPPNPQAFVVNIGDTFMALSNGIYKNCVHRVVVNSNNARRSLTFFLSPKGDKIVKPPKEIVIGERAYPDFTWSSFFEFTQKQYKVDNNTLQEFSNFSRQDKNKRLV